MSYGAFWEIIRANWTMSERWKLSALMAQQAYARGVMAKR